MTEEQPHPTRHQQKEDRIVQRVLGVLNAGHSDGHVHDIGPAELTKFMRFMESAKVIAASALLAAMLGAVYAYFSLMGITDVSPARIVLAFAWFFASLFVWEISRIIEWPKKRKWQTILGAVCILGISFMWLDRWANMWRLGHPPETAALAQSIQLIGASVTQLTEKTSALHVEQDVFKEIQAVPGYLKLEYRYPRLPVEQVDVTAALDVLYINKGSTYVHKASMKTKLFYVDFHGVAPSADQEKEVRKQVLEALNKEPLGGDEDIAPGAALWSSLQTPSVLTQKMVDSLQADTSRIYFVGQANWETNGITDHGASCVWLQPSTWAKVKDPVWHIC